MCWNGGNGSNVPPVNNQLCIWIRKKEIEHAVRTNEKEGSVYVLLHVTVVMRHEGDMSAICENDSKHFFNEPELQ